MQNQRKYTFGFVQGLPYGFGCGLPPKAFASVSSAYSLLDFPSVDFPVDFPLGVVIFYVNLSVGERGVACDFFHDSDAAFYMVFRM